MGCSGSGKVGLCVAARTADFLVSGRYGRRLRGVSQAFPKGRVSVPYRSQLGSASAGSSSEVSESIISRGETSFVGVSGFRVKICRIW